MSQVKEIIFKVLSISAVIIAVVLVLGQDSDHQQYMWISTSLHLS